MQEVNETEDIDLYHHELHKKKVTKSAILELETEKGILLGHKEHSEYINAEVANVLENEFKFNESSKRILLNEVEKVFT